MATKKTLDELETEITCLVCQGHYRDAKLLPCMHYYCKLCIEELAAKCKQGSSFPCPECRKETSLAPGSGGAAGLKSAFFVERMKGLFSKMSVGDGKVVSESACKTCAGKATVFCRECALFYCSECSKTHSDSGSLHRLIDLAKDKGSSVDPNPECQEHKDSMTVFCITCNSVACRECIILHHSGHNFNVLKKCALEKRSEVCNSLVPLRKILSDVTDAEKSLGETEEKIEVQGEAIHRSIHEVFAGLKSLLDQREAELASMATALVRGKRDTLAVQKKELQVVSAEIQSLVEFVERELESASDKDLMMCYSELQSRVKEGCEKNNSLALDPRSVADIVCDLPSPSIIPEKLGGVSCQSTIVKISSDCNVHQLSSSILKAASFVNITAVLGSLADPTCSVNATVTQTSSGVYEIAYTPKIRGRHTLSVKLDGADVPGSPFHIFANVHPSLMMQPVRVIDDVNQPMGITFNDSKQLIVTECSIKKLEILTKDGKKLRTINSESLKSPRGVAVGPGGTLFVTCNVTTGCEDYCYLFKLNANGDPLKTVPLDNPFCIRVIHNKLYVCVKGEVKIFDMDCIEIGKLKADRCTQPYDVAKGNDCIYVVSNTANGVIAKFSFDGMFQGLFYESLARPRCICVNSAGSVFVTFGKPCVAVFSPSGELLTSLGVGNSWKNPVGITVDEDDFIYVCDAHCHNIVVY